MIRNSYLSIAENDLDYLESVLHMGSTFYNQLAVQCQQVAEKFLKGYLDKMMVDEDVSDLLRRHNMKKIASKLNEINPQLNLDTIGLAYLTDFYFDARYPGDDFYTVTKEEFDKMYDIANDFENPAINKDDLNQLIKKNNKDADFESFVKFASNVDFETIQENIANR